MLPIVSPIGQGGKVYYIYDKQLRVAELGNFLSNLKGGYGLPEEEGVDLFAISRKFIPDNTPIRNASKKLYRIINKVVPEKFRDPLESQVVISPTGELCLISEIERTNDGTILYSLSNLDGYTSNYTKEEILPLEI